MSVFCVLDEFSFKFVVLGFCIFILYLVVCFRNIGGFQGWVSPDVVNSILSFFYKFGGILMHADSRECN